jgi:pyruvate,orthophosphate dikinase
MSGIAKQVYRFGSDLVDGNGAMGDILEGKGAGLAEMTMLSFPVPPGFTVTTDVCRFYLEPGTLPPRRRLRSRNCRRDVRQGVGEQPYKG